MDYFGFKVISLLKSTFAWSHHGRYNRNTVCNNKRIVTLVCDIKLNFAHKLHNIGRTFLYFIGQSSEEMEGVNKEQKVTKVARGAEDQIVNVAADADVVWEREDGSYSDSLFTLRQPF